MSQNDFNLANQGFPSMRADMNTAFQALASNSSGLLTPSTTYAYQWWYDETTNILKLRNSLNSAWIPVFTFDQAADKLQGFSGDIGMPDGAKLTFGGTGTGDLQIYHDGTNSYISDQGSNDLKILASDFQLKNAADNKFMITGVTDGAITLYHNNVSKFATTATGAVVNGDLVADGQIRFTPDGTNSLQGLKRSGFGTVYFVGTTTDSTDAIHTFTGSGDVAKMTILEGGNVGIGTANPSDLLTLNKIADGTMVSFQVGGSTKGSISCSLNTTTYGTTSDYRLKRNAQPMTGATERVQALNPVNFEWISDGTRVDGFLAHEAQEVVPEAVTGELDGMKDEEYEVTPAIYEDVVVEGTQGTPERTEQRLVSEAVFGTRSVNDFQNIDQSKIIPLLTAALKENIEAIASLKSRVEALEG